MRKYSQRFIALLGALTVLLVSCSSDAVDATVPDTSASGPGSLAGTRWVATGMFLGAAPAPLVPNGEPTLDFHDDGRTFGGSTGCKSFGGDYLRDGGAISFGEMNMTEMACEEPLMRQETRVLDILGQATIYTLEDGVLWIGRLGGSALQFIERSVAFSDVELTGTQWIADTIISGDTASTVVRGTEISLFIDAAASEARGSTGCNDYGASVEAARTQLTFGQIEVTERGCESDVMNQEAFVLSVLQGELRVEISADRLTLSTPTGDALSFRAGG
jgi:heat shock protein HslJ